ncbi:MAG: DEAD/DEAH box helicase family protein [Chitinophagaceae bacterium]|nr:DEAD/DEAH box helicase family protein [Chitinophagaceae bacterium]
MLFAPEQLATNTFTPRPYQTGAIDAAVNFFNGQCKEHGLVVLPTGAGKSIVIANIAKELEGNTIVFQPSKEILEQNYAKFISYGYRASIYSASAGQKKIDKITFATIGSVAKKQHLFKNYRNIIVDECHLVNSKTKTVKENDGSEIVKGGMYYSFFEAIEDCRILGLTATPYRLSTGMDGAMLKFLTRTRPKTFSDVLYVVQTRELFAAGYLAKLEYFSFDTIDRKMLSLNSTGSDFTEASLKAYYRKINFPKVTAYWANRIIAKRKNLLIFSTMISEAYEAARLIPDAVVLTGKTETRQRERILSDFKAGRIKVLVNVGVLTTGFDFPALEAVLIARSTMSLALYYQMCLDMETEVLTKRGFLKHGEINVSDEVAAYIKETGEIKWTSIKNIIHRPIAKEEYFIQYKNQHLDFRVTDNHDMIFRARGAKSYRKDKANEMMNLNCMIDVPVSAKEIIDDTDISDDQLLFLGLFLSDGSLNKVNNTINIVQSENYPLRLNVIEDCLKNCGFKFGKCIRVRKGNESKYSNMVHYSISHGMPRGKNKDKTGWSVLEKWINKSMNDNYNLLSERQFEILLKGVNLGDGRKYQSTDYKVSTMTIAMGINKTYADNFQSLCIRRGYRANMSIIKKEGFKDQYILNIKKISKSTIAGNNISDKKILNRSFKRTRMEKVRGAGENVWCIENEIGTIVTRRNGKVMMTGNCGRAMRPHPDKESAWIVDLGGNINFFGKIETLNVTRNNRGLWVVTNNGRQLTNVNFTKS